MLCEAIRFRRNEQKNRKKIDKKNRKTGWTYLKSVI